MNQYTMIIDIMLKSKNEAVVTGIRRPTKLENSEFRKRSNHKRAAKVLPKEPSNGPNAGKSKGG